MGIEDVAREAEVSIATVSRALSRPDKVSPATRDRVIQVANRIGYVPNSAARTLVTGSTGLVGIIVPNLCSPYFMPIISGAHTTVGQQGAELAITDSRGSPDQEVQIINRLRSRVDGLILVSPRSHCDAIIANAKTLPIITVNREISGVDSVRIEIRNSLKRLTDGLLANGTRRIGYIGGPPGSLADRDRYTTLWQHATAGGAECHYLATVEPSAAAAVAVVDTVRESGAQVIVAYNSLVAYGLLSALKEHANPGDSDVSIASADDLVDAGLGCRT